MISDLENVHPKHIEHPGFAWQGKVKKAGCYGALKWEKFATKAEALDWLASQDRRYTRILELLAPVRTLRDGPDDYTFVETLSYTKLGR